VLADCGERLGGRQPERVFEEALQTEGDPAERAQQGEHQTRDGRRRQPGEQALPGADEPVDPRNARQRHEDPAGDAVPAVLPEERGDGQQQRAEHQGHAAEHEEGNTGTLCVDSLPTDPGEP
jgi:hypothetical protein